MGRFVCIVLVVVLAACASSDERWSCDVAATYYCREYINVEGRSAVLDTSAAKATCTASNGTWRLGEECGQDAVGRCISDNGYITIDYYYNLYGGFDYEAEPVRLTDLQTACRDGARGSFQVPPFTEIW